MTPKQIGIAVVVVVVALGLSFSAGRWSAPTKTIEVTHEVKVRDELAIKEAVQLAVAEAKSEWKKNDKSNTKTVIKYLDGKPVEKIIYVDRVVDSSGSTSSTNTVASTNIVIDRVVDVSTKDTTKVTEKVEPRWKLSLAANLRYDKLPTSASDIIWEGRGEMRLVGGLWGGVTVTPQEKMAGLTVGFQF